MGKIIYLFNYFKRGFLKSSGEEPSLLNWIFSTDHKRIGLLYLYAICAFFALGVSLGLLLGPESFSPARTLPVSRTCSALCTLHGTVMIFLFIVPGIPTAFGNLFLPLQIGARDMAFPRLNLLAWWLYVTGALMAVASLLGVEGAPGTGWHVYLPFSAETAVYDGLTLFALVLLVLSALLTAINFIATVHRLRTPGMTWLRLPLFIWSLYAGAWVQLLATPLMGLCLLRLWAWHVLGPESFEAVGISVPIMSRCLLWVHLHPAIYILALPAMGVISEIIPVFARKPLVGYRAMLTCMLLLAVLGLLAWGTRLAGDGVDVGIPAILALSPYLAALLAAIMVGLWAATLYGGAIRPAPPMLYALSFMVFFSIGGLYGQRPGMATGGARNSLFEVAHFHYVLFGASGFAFIGALHYWFPKIYGRMYDPKRATWAWGLILVGFNLLYGPMLLAALQDRPRPTGNDAAQFTSIAGPVSPGAWLLAAGLVLMAGNLLLSMRRGHHIGANPWQAATLEWTVPSPPPAENFVTPPFISHGPYDLKKAGRP